MALSSSLSGFGAFDRKVFFGRADKGGISDSLLDRSEELEEESRDLRPVFDVW